MLLDIVKKGSTNRSIVLKIIDSTDGTPETGVVYNTAGIDLWYRREGAVKTSITEATLASLTTAHADGGFLTISDGNYRFDIPDAAFATSANYVDFGGTVTDMVVLGGRVRLVDYDLEDSVRLGLTAMPNAAADAAGGLAISDAGGLDLDGRTITATTKTALDNQYDGATGLSGGTYPATQEQLDNLSAGGGAPNVVSSAATITTGVETNTFADTDELNGTLHSVADSAGTTDYYYQFNVGGPGIPVSIRWNGYAQSNNDTYNIYAYNWALTNWDQVDTISAANGTTTIEKNWPTTVAHVGTGGNDGLVRIRVQSTTGTEFFTDRILCSYAVAFDSTTDPIIVGYWASSSNAVSISATTLLPEVDVTSISDDATPADNLELMYDGTGYTDSTGPSSRSQIDNIGAASGGSIGFAPSSDNTSAAIIDGVVKVWATVAGTYANLDSDDGSSHDFTDTTNVIDHVYGFSVGGGRQGVNVPYKCNVKGNADQMLLKVYDHVGAAWDTIAVLEGTGGTATISGSPAIFSKHTGTGSELGNVYIRFDTDSTTPSDLLVSVLNVEAVNIGQSVGYSNGSVYVDTLAGVAGTEAFVNGVADNPSNLWASAQTIATAVNLAHFHLNNGTSVTLDTTTDSSEIEGDEFTLALGGQSINNSSIHDALVVTGTFLGYPHILDCGVASSITAVTGPGAKMGRCALRGAVISNAATYRWVLHDCWGVSDTLSAFDFGAAVVAAQTVYITGYHGPINISNMDHADDKLFLSGNGSLIISASSTTGTIYLSGQWVITNNGTTTIVYDNVTTDVAATVADLANGTDGLGALKALIDIASGRYEENSVWVDTLNGAAGTSDFVNGVVDNPVNLIASAKTIATSIGLSNFNVANGSTITLAENSANESYFGSNWILALGSQDVSAMYVQGAVVSGIATASDDEVIFEDVSFETVSIQRCHGKRIGFSGTVTHTLASDYNYIDCYQKGSFTPVFAKTAGQTITAEFINYRGDISITGLQSGDIYELDGSYRTITIAGAGGTVNVYGNYDSISSGSFSGTLSITGAIKTADVAATLVDTIEIGVAGAGLTDLGGMSTGMKAEVNTEADTALSDIHLDHLFAVDNADVAVNGSYFALIMSTTEDASTFVPLTDSLQSLRDNQGTALTAATIWAYATRTLTTAASVISATVSGSSITIHRGDTMSISLTGLGSVASRSEIWFTMKSKSGNPADSASLIQIDTTTGLVIINGAAAATAANGSITIDDATAGDITITLKPIETAKLITGSGYVYDVQMLTTASVVSTLSSGSFKVNEDVTRDVS